VQKEIIIIIGGPGTGKSTIIDGLIAKGFVAILKFPEVTLEAKKQGIEQLFLENPLLFSELLLEGRKTIHENEPHDVVFIDRN
jgi:predicted ATPase